VDGQWQIYAVGPDLQDHGGDVAYNEDFGRCPIIQAKK
jgi:hypothetical protein